MGSEIEYNQLKKKYGSSLVPRTLHISRKFGYVYVTNPKAACSTLKLFLSRCEADNSEFVGKTNHQRRDLPLLTPGKLSKKERDGLTRGLFFRFSFVRHPVSRALSAYASKIFSGKSQSKSQILKMLGEDPGRLDLDISFLDFLKVISAREPSSLNGHFRPQTLNLYWDDFKYDFIGKLEQFDSDFTKLKKILSLPEYPLEIKNQKSRFVSKDKLLTDEALGIIRRFYAADFEAFDYQ